MNRTSQEQALQSQVAMRILGGHLGGRGRGRGRSRNNTTRRDDDSSTSQKSRGRHTKKGQIQNLELRMLEIRTLQELVPSKC